MTDQDDNKNFAQRPPVVVILGHVDHGKTTLLDYIRKVAAKVAHFGGEPRPVAGLETGGITQHIGAYQVEEGGNRITFLDTPGHEAFSAIRSRGAKVADIAVLVIAADERLKPQTKEAIEIIKEAKLPFLVAANKIDKEGANIDKLKQELAENEVFVEGYGGSIPLIEVSAKTGQGIDHLLEIVTLLAELSELKAKTDGLAKGVIIESHLDKRRGQVATLIVQEGVLKLGDYISAGQAIGKVKSLENFLGKAVESAGPSEPCVVLGWENAPSLGQEFKIVSNKKEAEAMAQTEKEATPERKMFDTDNQSLKTEKIANLIIKSDVQSSLEAIEQIMQTIKSDEIGYRVVNFGVGNITEDDIKNAKATNSSVIGFRVGIDEPVKRLAEREDIKIIASDIIYELVEKIRDMLSDLLGPEIERIELGKLKVLAIFGGKGSDSKSQIIGGKVIQGKAVRGAIIDVVRSSGKILTGRLSQLQQNKNDVAEVSEGLECGIRFDPIKTARIMDDQLIVRQITIQVGDVLEIYQENKIKKTI